MYNSKAYLSSVTQLAAYLVWPGSILIVFSQLSLLSFSGRDTDHNNFPFLDEKVSDLHN